MSDDDWRQRVVTERADLAARLRRLLAYLAKGAPGADAEDITLLQRQRDAMRGYLSALDERISRWRRA